MALKERVGFNKMLLINTRAKMIALERLGNSTIKRFKHALFVSFFKSLKERIRTEKDAKIHTKRPNYPLI